MICETGVMVGVLCLQMFLRDGTQAEVLLSQQDNFLSKEEVPVSPSVLFQNSNIVSSRLGKFFTQLAVL